MADLGTAAEADNHTAGVGVPVGRAKAGEGRDEDDVAGVVDGGGKGFDVCGRGEEAHVVAEPLDHGSADEDAAFEGVLELALGAAGEGGDEALLREGEGVADVAQQEASGAVGVFGLAGRDAELAEERGLLVSGDAGDGDVTEAERGGDGPDDFAGPADLRHHAGRDVEEAEEVFVPMVLDDVVEQGAAGVGAIGEVALAVGEIPEEPGVDGTEGELAVEGVGAGSWNVREDPGDLGGGEVGVEQETGLIANRFFGAVCGELLAEWGAAAVLPDDGVVDRLAGGAVPDEGGLALVGDADGDDVAGQEPGFAKDFDGCGELRGEDVVGIVFDAAGVGVDLRELMLGHADDGAIVREEKGSRAGGSLIEGEDVRHGVYPECAGAEPDHFSRCD